MVIIQYTDSKAGLPNCFSFLIPERNYTSQDYDRNSEGSTSTELQYFIDLLDCSDMVDISPKSGYNLIWEKRYDCVYNGHVPFTMVYDEDYDTISFTIDDNYMDRRTELAEAIQSLIESSK